MTRRQPQGRRLVVGSDDREIDGAHAVHRCHAGAQELVLALEDILAPDVVFVGPRAPEGVHGREAFIEFVRDLRRDSPGLRFEQGETIAEGDRVASVFTMTRRHRGRVIVTEGIDLVHVVDGRIQSVTAYFDRLPLLVELGLVSPPSPNRAFGSPGLRTLGWMPSCGNQTWPRPGLGRQEDARCFPASIASCAARNWSGVRRTYECRPRLRGKTPPASTGGAVRRSSSTMSGRIGNRQRHRSRVGSSSGSPLTSTTAKMLCQTAA